MASKWYTVEQVADFITAPDDEFEQDIELRDIENDLDSDDGVMNS